MPDKTYKVEATIKVKISLDVDAKTGKDARKEAMKSLKQVAESIPAEDDNIELEITNVQ